MNSNPIVTKLETVSKQFEIFGKKQAYALIAGSLTFISGLAWNDAIQSILNQLIITNPNSSIIFKFIYAFLITIISILFLFIIFKIIGN